MSAAKATALALALLLGAGLGAGLCLGAFLGPLWWLLEYSRGSAAVLLTLGAVAVPLWCLPHLSRLNLAAILECSWSSSARAVPGSGVEVPTRPLHVALRPRADPRIDKAMYVLYEPLPHKKTGATMVVVPGGNYDECGIAGSEGQDVAHWLVDMGITVVVLQYRLVSEGHYWPAQYEDWEDCARDVAKQAKHRGCDSKRIGVMGFSAGGHLASYAALRSAPKLRPALQVLIYPAIDTLSPRESEAMDPWDPKLGYPPPETTTHLHVGPSAPPAFLAGMSSDAFCPANENTDVYAEALAKHGVPYRSVTDHESEHGCGMQEWWTKPCAEWLAEQGFAKASDA